MYIPAGQVIFVYLSTNQPLTTLLKKTQAQEGGIMLIIMPAQSDNNQKHVAVRLTRVTLPLLIGH